MKLRLGFIPLLPYFLITNNSFIIRSGVFPQASLFEIKVILVQTSYPNWQQLALDMNRWPFLYCSSIKSVSSRKMKKTHLVFLISCIEHTTVTYNPRHNPVSIASQFHNLSVNYTIALVNKIKIYMKTSTHLTYHCVFIQKI